MATPLTDAECEAAAATFWATVTPSQLAGFPSNAETLANNLADETRNRSILEPLDHTPFFQEVNRPLEEDESPFDPDMFPLRATAIMGGWVPRAEDVGKPRVQWDEGEDDQTWTDTRTNSEKKRDWFRNAVLEGRVAPSRGGVGKGRGGNDRGRGGRGGSDRGHPRGGRGGSGRGRGGQQPPAGQATRQQTPPVQTRVDPGNFEDTDEFYLDSAEVTKNPSGFNPEAPAFTYCKPDGGFAPSRRKDDPDQDDDQGGGIGVPEQVV